MSQATVHGGLLFVAGQVAQGASVTEQTQAITRQIDELLAAAGSDKSRLLSANIWLTDIATFAEMNAVWDAWLPPNSGPARATVQATLANPQYRVEIMVVAAGPAATGARVASAQARPKVKAKAKAKAKAKTRR